MQLNESFGMDDFLRLSLISTTTFLAADVGPFHKSLGHEYLTQALMLDHSSLFYGQYYFQAGYYLFGLSIFSLAI